MNHIVLSLILILFHLKCLSQDFSKVDDIVNKYPNKVEKLDIISKKIKQDFNTPPEYARAAFSWIANNIEYDIHEIADIVAFSYKSEKEKNEKEKKFKEELIVKALQSGKAVCHGYSFLFETLCKQLGLESKVIIGTLKSDLDFIGKLPLEVNHAWNVVKVDGIWRLVDVTLAAGAVSEKTGFFEKDFNQNYFFTKPEMFFLNHFPVDKNWLMIEKKEKDFASLPVYFPDFFKTNYQIKPDFGIISKKSHNVSMEIVGLKDDDFVQYMLVSDSGETSSDFFERKNSENRFDIPVGEDKNTLIIFINRQPLIGYLVQ